MCVVARGRWRGCSRATSPRSRGQVGREEGPASAWRARSRGRAASGDSSRGEGGRKGALPACEPRDGRAPGVTPGAGCGDTARRGRGGASRAVSGRSRGLGSLTLPAPRLPGVERPWSRGKRAIESGARGDGTPIPHASRRSVGWLRPALPAEPRLSGKSVASAGSIGDGTGFVQMLLRRGLRGPGGAESRSDPGVQSAPPQGVSIAGPLAAAASASTGRCSLSAC